MGVQKREPMSHTNLGLCDSVFSILIHVKLVLHYSCAFHGGREKILSKSEFEAIARKGWLYT